MSNCESEEESYASAEDRSSEAPSDDAEEHCGLTSDESEASSVSSLGVGSIMDAEPSESEASSAEEELVGDVCSACDDDDADAEVDSPPAEQSLEHHLSNVRLQIDAGQRARAGRMRDAPFLEWQAERAAARRAASGNPASDAGSQASAPGSPAAGSRASTPASVAPTADYVLERPRALPLLLADDLDERRAQVAELVARDPRAAVWLAREIFRRLPTVELPAEADRVYAALPTPDETIERPTAAQPSPAGPPRTLGARRTAGEPFIAPRRTERCKCCDAAFGNGESSGCPALRLLTSLADDLAERDAIVEHEIDTGYDEAGVYRAARWFLYRQCIALQYGHLGRGVRIKLPNCVVGAIRSRWREPSCTCETIVELATCRLHGYTGFRAA